MSIKMTKAEKQSGTNRIQHAEGLILQLPETHEGRNTWLVNYGFSLDAVKLRKQHGLIMDEKTMSAIRP